MSTHQLQKIFAVHSLAIIFYFYFLDNRELEPSFSNLGLLLTYLSISFFFVLYAWHDGGKINLKLFAIVSLIGLLGINYSGLLGINLGGYGKHVSSTMPMNWGRHTINYYEEASKYLNPNIQNLAKSFKIKDLIKSKDVVLHFTKQNSKFADSVGVGLKNLGFEVHHQEAILPTECDSTGNFSLARCEIKVCTDNQLYIQKCELFQ